ncbi:MAG: tetratricopeptide repeat protein [Planctomycetaceae bacterium]
MSSDKKKLANDCFKKGTEAMSKENWDYSIEMFLMAARLEPHNLLYRQSLRGCEYRKYGENKNGAGLGGKMKIMSIRSRIKKAKANSDWNECDKAAEEGLVLYPWDAQLLADLGDAARGSSNLEIAVDSYKRAVLSAPENRDFLRTLGELLEERGEYAAALEHWNKILKLDPYDSEARSKITQLRASEVIDRGGYGGAESTRQVIDIKSAYDVDLEERMRSKEEKAGADGPGMSLEADLQREIRRNPTNKDNYLKLADFYRRDGNLPAAAETFQKAFEMSGGDPNIRELLEDVQLEQMKHNVEIARTRAAKNPEDKQTAENAQALKKEYRQREIEIIERRTARYPADMRLKYQLAQRYMSEKYYSKAIPLLQKASADTRIEADVFVALGECFIQEKKLPLAKHQFEKAMPKISHEEKPDAFKKTHYYLARICEEAKDKQGAELHFNEILAVDYEYKDARDRLEKMQSGEGDEG